MLEKKVIYRKMEREKAGDFQRTLPPPNLQLINDQHMYVRNPKNKKPLEMVRGKITGVPTRLGIVPVPTS